MGMLSFGCNFVAQETYNSGNHYTHNLTHIMRCDSNTIANRMSSTSLASMAAIHQTRAFSAPSLVRDQKTFFSPFSLSSVMLILIKNFLVQKIEKKVEELDEEDADIDVSLLLSPSNQDYEFNLFHNFVPQMKFVSFRDLSVLQCTRTLEHLILPQVTHKKAKSLVKDVTKSAVRKVKRYGNGPTASCKLFVSSMKAQSLFFLSVFGFNVGFGLVSLHLAQKESSPEVKLSSEQKRVEIGKIIGFELVQVVKTWVSTCIGAVIGTVLYPGIGTLLMMNIAPLILVPVMDKALLHLSKKVIS
eukprot:snap_masked-scaffold_4-processed-gene-3.40-mRNA-1 protein AED:1.00 eAED:1.00 QI:0/0/0/0/1/1/2/0/300